MSCGKVDCLLGSGPESTRKAMAIQDCAWSGGTLLLLALTSFVCCASAAEVGQPMELTAPYIAVTPAAAEAPSSGGGPVILNLTRNPSPQPQAGQDIPITVNVVYPAQTVTLNYMVDFDPQEAIPMTSGANGQYSASIPATAFNASSMVRWYVTASGVNQQTSRLPPEGTSDQFYGTVIADPTINFKIPVMEWFTNNVTGSMVRSGANGSSVYFLGRFYDNITVRRKGVTSLNWPKPKLKFKLANQDFVYKPSLNKTAQEHKVKTFDLNSLYYEPGQKSYMREAIAYQVLQDVGAVSAINYHIILRLNGAFYGLYTYTENDDKDYLERNGLSKGGLLIKPTSGSDGNLGYTVPVDQLQYSYKQQNHAQTDYWPDLYSFTQGIAGAGNETRSLFVFDYVELSETINTMAVLTMLLTQDRCTKNYLLYLDLNTSKWQMFAYDLKSALNADAGYQGKPATDYCTLECAQWNSPLYCDRDHPQDVTTNTTSPWTFISAASIGRRLHQIANNGPNQANANITNPNENLTLRGNISTGASETYNYLIDLITQVPATRQMYMRRLRTLTDYYYNGRLISMVTDMYNLIHEAADADNQKWHIGNITLGYLQLTTEQIPTRRNQLLTIYGLQGQPALLPDTQPPQAPLAFGRADAVSAAEQQFVEIVNNNTYAVDVSGWSIAGAATITIKPGTVIAAKNSLVIATDAAGFKQRTTPPTMGQGFQVIGKLAGNLAAQGGIQLLDDTGAVITSKASASASLAG